MGSGTEAVTPGMIWLRACLAAGALWALTVAGVLAEPACRPDQVLLRGAWGQARFSVELAVTPAERSQGLMFRETLPKSSGMLFIYERPQRVAFWMKNTLIPLDMIFVDATGVVQKVHSNAIPGDLTAIPGGDRILVVLEINAGLARAMGIGPGTVLRHPAFARASAAWPC